MCVCECMCCVVRGRRGRVKIWLVVLTSCELDPPASAADFLVLGYRHALPFLAVYDMA